MESFRLRRPILIVAVLALLTMAGGGWWLCERSDSIAFLPASSGAEWIMDPAPVKTDTHWAIPIRVIFKRPFSMAAVPENATLTLRAFKHATVSINGRELSNLKSDGKNWKSPVTVSVGGLLRAGTNEITVCVTNNFGPPALWLQLQAGAFSLGSDGSWLTSPTGDHWLNARLASQPPVLPDWSTLPDRTRTIDSVRRDWRELALFAAVASGLVFCVGLWLKKRAAPPAPSWTFILLAVVLAARVALFNHDAPLLPRETGFDSTEHEDYIRFVQEKKSLPLPNDGWEMHQPPLYYLVSALWLSLGNQTAGQDSAELPLHAVNGLIGLAHCGLVLLCLRRLFPQSLSAQAVGLLAASFLPANLYLSMYVTNDPLAALLVTLAFYFFLRLREDENKNLKPALVIGLALGAATLTKLNSALAVPVFLAAMGLRLLARDNFSGRDWLRSIGVTALACLVLCGWHYGRVWIQIGALPLPNSQTNPSAAWWQEPGFRTAGYYLHCGEALDSPSFSGLHSFADGIYSTLWGDGLISGYSTQSFRPPWNYDLMNAGYLLALPVTLLALVGLTVSLRKIIRATEPAWCLIVGMVFAFAAGIVFLTLHGPWLAHVKAFYALPALVPFSALIAAGWISLVQKNRVARAALWIVVLLWAFTAYNSFWIRSDNGQFWRVRAMARLDKRDLAGATESLARATQLEPTDADNHRIMADVFNCQGRTIEAIREYALALNLQPDSPATLDLMAQMLVNGGTDDVERAAKFATQSCELTHYRQAIFVTTLAAAEARAGRLAEAVSAAQTASELAMQDGNAILWKKNQELLKLLQNPRAVSK